MNLKYVKRIGLVAALLLTHPGGAQPSDADAGEPLFQTYCAACHSIGEGRRVGPDLVNVHQRRSSTWLQQFIISPQALADAGDADALALLDEYSPMVMPDSSLSAPQVTQVIAYIESSSGGAAAGTAVADSDSAAAGEPVSEQAVTAGARLFEGSTRFSNGGPACNGCHDINSNRVTAGASLAADLTSAFSRMSGAGLGAIMAQTPFPAMQVAYGDKPLTQAEIDALIAFFTHSDSVSDAQVSPYFGQGMLLSGILGAAVLFGLMPLWWRKRRTASVNQSIYDRQDRTE